MGVQFFKEISKFGYFTKLKKIKIKLQWVGGEIEIVLSKKSSKNKLVFGNEKCLVLGGWMGVKAV